MNLLHEIMYKAPSMLFSPVDLDLVRHYRA